MRQLCELVAGVVARTATLVRLRMGSRRKRLPGKFYFSSGSRLAFPWRSQRPFRTGAPGREDGWNAFRCRRGRPDRSRTRSDDHVDARIDRVGTSAPA